MERKEKAEPKMPKQPEITPKPPPGVVVEPVPKEPEPENKYATPEEAMDAIEKWRSEQ